MTPPRATGPRRAGLLRLAALVVAVLVALATAGAAAGSGAGSAEAANGLATSVVLVSATSLDRSGDGAWFAMTAFNAGDESVAISVPAPAPTPQVVALSGEWDGLRWQVVLRPEGRATLRGG